MTEFRYWESWRSLIAAELRQLWQWILTLTPGEAFVLGVLAAAVIIWG